MEVYLRLFLILIPEGSKCLSSLSGSFTPGNHWLGGCNIFLNPTIPGRFGGNKFSFHIENVKSVTRMVRQGTVYIILVGKPKVKKPLRRNRNILEDNIKVKLK